MKRNNWKDKKQHYNIIQRLEEDQRKRMQIIMRVRINEEKKLKMRQEVQLNDPNVTYHHYPIAIHNFTVSNHCPMRPSPAHACHTVVGSLPIAKNAPVIA